MRLQFYPIQYRLSAAFINTYIDRYILFFSVIISVRFPNMLEMWMCWSAIVCVSVRAWARGLAVVQIATMSDQMTSMHLFQAYNDGNWLGNFILHIFKIDNIHGRARESECVCERESEQQKKKKTGVCVDAPLQMIHRNESAFSFSLSLALSLVHTIMLFRHWLIRSLLSHYLGVYYAFDFDCFFYYFALNFI